MTSVLMGLRDHQGRCSVQKNNTEHHAKPLDLKGCVTHPGHPEPSLILHLQFAEPVLHPGVGLRAAGRKRRKNALRASGAARNQEAKPVIPSAFTDLQLSPPADRIHVKLATSHLFSSSVICVRTKSAG